MKRNITVAAMTASTNGASRDSLCKMRDELQKKMDEINSIIKIQDEIDALNREYEAKVAELKSRMSETIKNKFDVAPVLPETTKNSTTEEEVSSKEDTTEPEDEPAKSEEPAPIKDESADAKKNIFDNPEFGQSYNPIAAKGTPNPSSKEDEDTPSMRDILSEDPDYEEYYASKEPIKNEKGRRMISMKELTSGEPVDEILCLGLKEDKKFKQHERICDASGLCPTLTATGNTTYVFV